MRYSKKILSSVLIGTQLLSMLGGVPIEASVNSFFESTVSTTTSIEEAPEDDTSVSNEETPDNNTTTSDEEAPEDDTSVSNEETPDNNTTTSDEEAPEDDTSVSNEETPDNNTTTSDEEAPEDDTSVSNEETPDNNTTTSIEEAPEDDTSVSNEEVKNDTLSNGIQSKEENIEIPVKNINSNNSISYLSQSNIAISQDDVVEETINAGTKYNKNKITEEFIEKIGEYAREIAQKNNLYGSVMIAQAILESGSGTSMLSKEPNYNLFGIKGDFKGQSVTFNTQEDLGNGNIVTVEEQFKKYSSYKDSLKDYANLMKNGLDHNRDFYSGVWKTKTKNYQEATKFLTGKYATDTEYNKKLNGLIETYDLTEYDKTKSMKKNLDEEYIIPLEKYTFSSDFGNRWGEFHRGIDLAAPLGAPIYAANDGIVKKAEYHYSWGNYVVIEHKEGTASLYAHQDNLAVKETDKVKKGQIIGYVGTTGNSTGPHLHLEICKDLSLSKNKLINPKLLINFN